MAKELPSEQNQFGQTQYMFPFVNDTKSTTYDKAAPPQPEVIENQHIAAPKIKTKMC